MFLHQISKGSGSGGTLQTETMVTSDLKITSAHWFLAWGTILWPWPTLMLTGPDPNPKYITVIQAN